MWKTDNMTGRRLKIYLAGPLFSDAEQRFNVMVASSLENWVDVYLPQRDGGLISEMIHDGISADVAVQRVFRGDLDAIREADCLIAVLDGRAIDEDVAFELGVAYSQSKRCVGIQTDSRRLASWGNNPMITGALELVLHSVEELMAWTRNELLESTHAGHGTTTSQMEISEVN